MAIYVITNGINNVARVAIVMGKVFVDNRKYHLFLNFSGFIYLFCENFLYTGDTFLLFMDTSCYLKEILLLWYIMFDLGIPIFVYLPVFIKGCP